MLFGHILVPVDFSPDSRRALEIASEVAQRLGSELHLLNALGLRSYPFGAEYLTDQASAPSEGAAYDELARWKDEFVPSGLTAQLHVRPEEPSAAIAAAVRELKVSLIVMGTHGRSKLDTLILGSVAAHTVRTASCPVLTVRSDADVPGA